MWSNMLANASSALTKLEAIVAPDPSIDHQQQPVQITEEVSSSIEPSVPSPKMVPSDVTKEVPSIPTETVRSSPKVTERTSAAITIHHRTPSEEGLQNVLSTAKDILNSVEDELKQERKLSHNLATKLASSRADITGFEAALVVEQSRVSALTESYKREQREKAELLAKNNKLEEHLVVLSDEILKVRETQETAVTAATARQAQEVAAAIASAVATATKKWEEEIEDLQKKNGVLESHLVVLSDELLEARKAQESAVTAAAAAAVTACERKVSENPSFSATTADVALPLLLLLLLLLHSLLDQEEAMPLQSSTDGLLLAERNDLRTQVNTPPLNHTPSSPHPFITISTSPNPGQCSHQRFGRSYTTHRDLPIRLGDPPRSDGLSQSGH